MTKKLLLTVFILSLVSVLIIIFSKRYGKIINLSGIASVINTRIQNQGLISYDKNFKNQYCVDNDTNTKMSYWDLLQIAQKDNCGEGAKLQRYKKNYSCNETTGTFWIDVDIKDMRSGCNPACVVNIVEKTAEINARCTGLSL